MLAVQSDRGIRSALLALLALLGLAACVGTEAETGPQWLCLARAFRPQRLAPESGERRWEPPAWGGPALVLGYLGDEDETEDHDEHQ